MKWVLLSVGLLVVIVVFSLAALDQKDVVWVGDDPECPHCRSEVNLYSNVCRVCDRAFDWQTHTTTCTECLSDFDAADLQKLYEESPEAYRQALVAANVPETALDDLVEYVESMGVGTCGFCGGTGDWLAPGVAEGEPGDGGVHPLDAYLKEKMDGQCPICLGSGRCISCDGDHSVEHGREVAARDLAIFEERWHLLDADRDIDPERDVERAEQRFSLLTHFVHRHRGRAEIRELSAFDYFAPRTEYPLISRAKERARFIKETLTGVK